MTENTKLSHDQLKFLLEEGNRQNNRVRSSVSEEDDTPEFTYDESVVEDETWDNGKAFRIFCSIVSILLILVLGGMLFIK